MVDAKLWGRMRLRPNRAFPGGLCCDVTPMELVLPVNEQFTGVARQGRMTREAPALVGRSSV
jgi:hypothetical protein